MQDQYEDFRICHRLQAARLLTIYGNEDAPNFIADNTLDSSPRRDRPNSKRQTKFDTELARLIREDTGDGRSIARFLVNVMVGELRSFRPHHRMAAARELLNRGFGKSAQRGRWFGHPEMGPVAAFSSRVETLWPFANVGRARWAGRGPARDTLGPGWREFAITNGSSFRRMAGTQKDGLATARALSHGFHQRPLSLLRRAPCG